MSSRLQYYNSVLRNSKPEISICSPFLLQKHFTAKYKVYIQFRLKFSSGVARFETSEYNAYLSSSMTSSRCYVLQTGGCARSYQQESALHFVIDWMVVSKDIASY